MKKENDYITTLTGWAWLEITYKARSKQLYEYTYVTGNITFKYFG